MDSLDEIAAMTARCFKEGVSAVMAYAEMEDGRHAGPWSVSRTTDMTPLTNRWSHTHLYAYPASIGAAGIGLLFSPAFSEEQMRRLYAVAQGLRQEGDPALLGCARIV